MFCRLLLGLELLIKEHELAYAKNSRHYKEANSKSVEGVPPDDKLLIGAVCGVQVDSRTGSLVGGLQVGNLILKRLVVQGLVFGGSCEGARDDEEEGGDFTEHESENAQENLFECTWIVEANPVE